MTIKIGSLWSFTSKTGHFRWGYSDRKSVSKSFLWQDNWIVLSGLSARSCTFSARKDPSMKIPIKFFVPRTRCVLESSWFEIDAIEWNSKSGPLEWVSKWLIVYTNQNEAHDIIANHNAHFKTQPVWQFQFHKVQHFALKFHFKFYRDYFGGEIKKTMRQTCDKIIWNLQIKKNLRVSIAYC